MSTTLIDNFSYRSRRFLDARQGVATLAELRAVAAADIPEGFRAYCAETALWYEYSSSNTTDPSTGKWRQTVGIEQIANIEKNLDILSNKTYSLCARKSVGKNLFNKAAVTHGYWVGGDGGLNASEAYCVSEYIPVEPDTTYAISNTSTGGASNVWFDDNLAAIGTAAKKGVTTSPSNAAFIRLSVQVNCVDQAQFEKGEKVSGYEPYTENYSNEQSIASLQAELDETNRHITDVESTLPKTTPGKNLFNPATVVVGFLYENGDIAGHKDYVTSEFISVDGGKTITASGLASGPIYFCQFNALKELITSEQNAAPKTIVLEKDTCYIRATFKAADYLTAGQIEYSSVATEFEQFKAVVSEEALPQGFGTGTTPQEVQQIIDTNLFTSRLILPKDLYFMMGRQNNLYFKQAVKCGSNEAIDFSVNDTSAGLKVYDRQMSGSPSTARVYSTRLTIHKSGRLVDQKEVRFNIIAAPTAPKQIKILDVGDSISDLGGYQAALKQQLESHGVSVEYIGTMINSVNVGTQQSPDYLTDIHGEVQSGGNMSFITEHGGASKILTVSGITSLPQTGYPGTAYTDSNGNDWVVRGFKVTQGSDGKYSGKLKIGKFKADPNYGDTEAGKDQQTGAFPSSGTLTKTNSSLGDSSISYSAATDARYNPFWNPSTNQLDFQYYLDTWGFELPDVFIMQWGYNEVGNFEVPDSENVETAVSRAKAIIDRFHSQCPNCRIVFGIEIYGREAPGYHGSSCNNANGHKYSILSFAERLIELFEGSKDATGTLYRQYVTLVPLYALFDHVYGYGPLTEKTLCDLYSYATTTVGQNGNDGVHPSFSVGGLKEIGRAYEPVILSLIQ